MQALRLALLLALAGCAGVAQGPYPIPGCSSGDQSFACQTERYDRISAP